MSYFNFRNGFMPYCVKQVEKGHFVILNREYKPLGQINHDRVNYKDHMVEIKELTCLEAAALSVHGHDDLSAIYLYNDDCIPGSSAKHTTDYFDRLGILMNLEVEEAA